MHAKLEVFGPDGGAVQVQTEVTVTDVRLLTPDQLNAFKQPLRAAQAQELLGGWICSLDPGALREGGADLAVFVSNS